MLNGLVETLQKHEPVLLLERAGVPDVPDTLAGLGYRPFVYDRRWSRFVPDLGQRSQNVFYLNKRDAAAVAR